MSRCCAEGDMEGSSGATWRKYCSWRERFPIKRLEMCLHMRISVSSNGGWLIGCDHSSRGGQRNSDPKVDMRNVGSLASRILTPNHSSLASEIEIEGTMAIRRLRGVSVSSPTVQWFSKIGMSPKHPKIDPHMKDPERTLKCMKGAGVSRKWGAVVP